MLKAQLQGLQLWIPAWVCRKMLSIKRSRAALSLVRTCQGMVLSAVPCRHSMRTEGGTLRAMPSVSRLTRFKKSCGAEPRG